MDLPRVAGGWKTIVADPPWSFRDKGSRAAPDWAGARRGYVTMRARDVIAMPVETIVARNAHLYLWTTDSHLEAALIALRGWGFEFKHSIAWVKRGASGKLQIGMGHYWRHAHELVLFGIRGSQRIRHRGLPTVVEAPRGEHSSKPELFQDLVEKASPGPRLELFARRERPGWVCWGNEL